MGINRLKVFVQNRMTGKIQTRSWNKAELLKSIAWLKRMNARGNDIRVQPDEGHALVLLEALNQESLATMGRSGFELAVTVETRQGVFQAWIKLAARAATEKALLGASEGLARRFRGTADTTGYLAGFTVRSAADALEGRPRFVLAHDGQRHRASRGTEYLAEIERGLHEQVPRSRPSGRGPDPSR
jgi:hypothetical protein